MEAGVEVGGGRVETEWETLGRRRLAEEREKGALENHLSFSLFPSTSRATARRGAKRYAGGRKGEIERRKDSSRSAVFNEANY